MSNVDMGAFDKNDDDRAKISRGLWVPCRLCQNAFRRVRLTARYCDDCGVAFCEGEHGNFSHKRGRCVQCGPKAAEFVE